ncbi:MAG: hypothetical protein FWH02_03160 [Oscillospiraceae bacterium]|nr:hypothetical protein [Oscillospiraceae bacterium]
MKVTAAIILAAIVAAGAGLTAFADEDIIFPEQNSAGAGTPPAFSTEDYQAMHDGIANPTGRGGGPAFGTRYGEVYVEMPDDLLEDEAFRVAPAAATVDNVPMLENETQAEYEARLEREAADTMDGSAPHTQSPGIGGVEGIGAAVNPNTGAAGMALPMMAAGAAILAAVPFARKKK